MENKQELLKIAKAIIDLANAEPKEANPNEPKIFYRIFNIDNMKIYPIDLKDWDDTQHDPFFESHSEAHNFITEHFVDCNDNPAYTLVILPVFSTESKYIPE